MRWFCAGLWLSVTATVVAQTPPTASQQPVWRSPNTAAIGGQQVVVPPKLPPPLDAQQLPGSLPAVPPVPADVQQRIEKLRSQREGIARDRQEVYLNLPRPEVTSRERDELNQKILTLMSQLSSRPNATLPRPPRSGAPPTPDVLPADPLGLARIRAQAGDYEAALRTFRLIAPEVLSREDRAFVQYMSACCLRHLGKRSEATALFREVADARDDEFLAECALWQISAIRWQQETEAQLEELRRRRIGH